MKVEETKKLDKLRIMCELIVQHANLTNYLVYDFSNSKTWAQVLTWKTREPCRSRAQEATSQQRWRRRSWKNLTN